MKKKSSELRKILEKKNMDDKMLVSLTGISYRTLSRYLDGSKGFKNAPLWLALRISDALNISPNVLLNLSSEKEKLHVNQST